MPKGPQIALWRETQIYSKNPNKLDREKLETELASIRNHWASQLFRFRNFEWGRGERESPPAGDPTDNLGLGPVY